MLLTSSSPSDCTDFKHCFLQTLQQPSLKKKKERKKATFQPKRGESVFPLSLKNKLVEASPSMFSVSTLHSDEVWGSTSELREIQGWCETCQRIVKTSCNLHFFFSNQVSQKWTNAFEPTGCCNIGSRTMCFSAGLFAEVVINTVGGRLLSEQN